MANYRKKPIVIQATQWFDMGDHPAVVEGWQSLEHPEEVAPYAGKVPLPPVRRWVGLIPTKEGYHVVSPGDWIITGIQGEVYPCKPDIFAATYEDAEPIPFDEPLAPPLDNRPTVASLKADAQVRISATEQARIENAEDKALGLSSHKYRVERLGGTPHKHDDCEFFVLDWQHDPFTIPAILAYANACEAEYPALAEDLRRKMLGNPTVTARAVITTPRPAIEDLRAIVPAARDLLDAIDRLGGFIYAIQVTRDELRKVLEERELL
jgi:hypothetical protein